MLYAFFGVILLVNGLMDLRKRQIFLWSVVVGMAVGLIFRAFQLINGKEIEWANGGICIAFLIVMTLAGWFEIGISGGDLLILWMSFFYINSWQFLLSVFVAFSLSAGVSLFYVLKRKGLKYEIPFVPIYAVSVLIVVAGGLL